MEGYPGLTCLRTRNPEMSPDLIDWRDEWPDFVN